MVLNQMNSIDSCGCGTVNRCVGCSMKYVCAKSPYCCISNNGSSIDLAPMLNAISELSNTVSQQSQLLTTIASMINKIDNEIKTINTNITELSTSITSNLSDLTNKIDTNQTSNDSKLTEILNKLPSSANAEPVSLLSGIDSMNDSGLVPYSANSDKETVLVEKKGMFGKTKWVEEKKK